MSHLNVNDGDGREEVENFFSSLYVLWLFSTNCQILRNKEHTTMAISLILWDSLLRRLSNCDDDANKYNLLTNLLFNCCCRCGLILKKEGFLESFFLWRNFLMRISRNFCAAFTNEEFSGLALFTKFFRNHKRAKILDSYIHTWQYTE